MSDWYDAPCVFCGYNGPGYYQLKTHDPKCPFYDSVRRDNIREIIAALRTQLEGYKENEANLQATIKGLMKDLKQAEREAKMWEQMSDDAAPLIAENAALQKERTEYLSDNLTLRKTIEAVRELIKRFDIDPEMNMDGFIDGLNEILGEK